MEFLTPPTPFQLVYPDKSGCTNILLIENEMKDPTVFYDSANDATFPILYSSTSSKSDLLALLRSKFESIDRIALAFNSNLGTIKQFLDNQPFFSEESNENVTFIISLIQEFNVKHIDYLACQTLNYSIWTNYYASLTTATGVIVGASNDQTGNIKYGGDWVLENTSQDVESIYFTESIEYYKYVLDNPYTTFATFSAGYGPIQIISNGPYLYTLNGNGNNSGLVDLFGTINFPYFINHTGGYRSAIIGQYYYVSSYYGQIYKYALNGTLISSNFTPSKTGYTGESNICGDDTNFIVSYNSSNVISLYNISGSLVTANWISVTQPAGMLIRGNYIYVIVNSGYSSVGTAKINIYNYPAGTLVTSNWVTGLSNPWQAPIVYGEKMYVANRGTSSATNLITEINIATAATSTFISGFSELNGIAINGSSMYIANNTSLIVYKSDLPSLSGNLVCFKEGSKILTDKGYLPIQHLRKGALVKTLLHGFVPIDMIGCRKIIHRPVKERIKDQLYICSREEYPEVFEPLVITGCHSILVDEYASETQKQNTIKVNGDTYITDDQYRLPACADERAKVYDVPGTYTIYHIALEHTDYYMNYGIYANGLLVETCSKRFLKELSNMEIIE